MIRRTLATTIISEFSLSRICDIKSTTIDFFAPTSRVLTYVIALMSLPHARVAENISPNRFTIQYRKKREIIQCIARICCVITFSQMCKKGHRNMTLPIASEFVSWKTSKRHGDIRNTQSTFLRSFTILAFIAWKKKGGTCMYIYIYVRIKAVIKTLMNKYYIYILQHVTKNELRFPVVRSTIGAESERPTHFQQP